MAYTTRNAALGFARRTRKNLDFISHAYLEGADVHVITQVASSLLGLIVFPKEKNLHRRFSHLSLDDLVAQGWPKWNFSFGTSDTLDDLVYHLRNAVAHGHMSFSSDSRHVEEVSIEVEDYQKKGTKLYWRASIGINDLQLFCYKFVDLIEETIG
jgi:hypothetical protein